MSENQTILYASNEQERTGINLEKFVQRQNTKEQSPNANTSPSSSDKFTPVRSSPEFANAQVLTDQSTKGIPL